MIGNYPDQFLGNRYENIGKRPTKMPAKGRAKRAVFLMRPFSVHLFVLFLKKKTKKQEKTKKKCLFYFRIFWSV